MQSLLHEVYLLLLAQWLAVPTQVALRFTSPAYLPPNLHP